MPSARSVVIIIYQYLFVLLHWYRFVCCVMYVWSSKYLKCYEAINIRPPAPVAVSICNRNESKLKHCSFCKSLCQALESSTRHPFLLFVLFFPLFLFHPFSFHFFLPYSLSFLCAKAKCFARLCHRLGVCPSVCHTRNLYQNGAS